MWINVFLLTVLTMPMSSVTTMPSVATMDMPRQDKVQLTLSPRAVMAGSSVRAIVRVDRHPANRLLRVEIDGPEYLGCTERDLDGGEAARTYEMVWQTLPAGEYVVSVDVEGETGRRHHVVERLTVIGADK